ncbi:MAG: hypothetical protein PVJ98_10485, partial [Akkermansiaceae bacterium]
ALDEGEVLLQAYLRLDSRDFPGAPIQSTETVPLYLTGSGPAEGLGVFTVDASETGPSGEINEQFLGCFCSLRYHEISFVAETSQGTFVDDNVGAYFVSIPEPQSMMLIGLWGGLMLRRRRN